METLSALFNLETALSALRVAMPLFMVALGALIAERAGVLNIATEGMMLAGAFTSVAATVVSGGNWWLGMIIGGVGGLAVGAILALLCVSIKADQVVVGITINIFVLGITTLLFVLFFTSQTGSTTATTKALPFWAIPGLAEIPVLGPLLFRHEPIVYIGVIIAIIAFYMLFRTRAGLTLRSVGEHARAADTLGISVTKVRWIATLIAGFLGGLGGAFLALNSVHGFVENMTAGRGYIALAIVIFGKWNPLGALAAAFIFGTAEGLTYRVQGLGLPISAQIPNMIPYILTLLALLGLVGRSRPPAEDGVPYVKEEA